MLDVVFFVQYKSMGSSSHGIRSGGVVLDLKDLCDKDYMRRLMQGSYNILYQVGRGELKSIIHMSLAEFENIFKHYTKVGNLVYISHLLGYQGEKSIFRKEITEKYGYTKESVSTTQSYEAGDLITGVDGVEYLYMGNVKKLEIYIDHELRGSYSGHFYIPMRSNDKATTQNELYNDWLRITSANFKKASRSFLKTKRKAVADSVKKIGLSGLGKGTTNVEKVLPKCYLYSYERKLTAISLV